MGNGFLRSTSALIPAEKFAYFLSLYFYLQPTITMSVTIARCICTTKLSHAVTKAGSTSRLPVRYLHTSPSHIATTSYLPSQFSIPQLLPFPNPTSPYEGQGKGKGKGSEPPKSNEEEVDDAEWQMRVGESHSSLEKARADSQDGR
jgi:hypothetical protein